jgi:hypothetical protein
MTTQLVGKTFDFNLGAVRLRFTFDSVSQATFVIVEGGGMVEVGHTETVAIDLREIREGLYLNTWTEASGATVTHVEDFAQSRLFSTATIAGTLYTFSGTITEV